MGVIKARVLAAKAAQAPVIVFLDSHCEVTKGNLSKPIKRFLRLFYLKTTSPFVCMSRFILFWEPTDIVPKLVFM